jgi:hypothetical protein
MCCTFKHTCRHIYIYVDVSRVCVQEKGMLLDARSLALAGEPTWIRSGLQIFSRSSTMNSHDWLQMIQSAGDYIMADIVSNERRETALFALVDACQLCLTMISPAGIDDRDEILKLKIKVAEALSLCELVKTLYVLVVVVDFDCTFLHLCRGSL